MTLRGELGTGQAQVLAALIRRAGSAPVTLGQLARDTGLTRTRVRRCVHALDARDLLALTDTGPIPLVAPLTIEQAAHTPRNTTTPKEAP